ncbi:MAG: VOC family protein [Comamonadaceae bacterium]|nr:VOC family protein [Burkholderiales bacterium]MEB2349251.1 VOC family protein [Comamonadaceae bacterium]
MAFLRQVVRGAVAVACAGAAALAVAGPQTLPGVRGIDHIGFTVPDMEQAVTFYQDVIGCKKAMSFGPFSDPKGTFMQDLVNVHPRAEIKQIVEMRCGQGANIELFEYSAPDQKTEMPRNSDYGGYHLGFYVKDIKKAVEKARALGLKTMMGPVPIEEGPAAGQSITYVLTPWGQQLELISYPKGMAYEKTSKTKLWAPGR